jgi:hypothetical protein
MASSSGWSNWRSAAPRPNTMPFETTTDKLAAMQALNTQRSLLWMNRLTARCFDECVTDMAMMRRLRTGEEQCVDACTQKFMALHELVGDRFAHNLLGSEDGAPRIF